MGEKVYLSIRRVLQVSWRLIVGDWRLGSGGEVGEECLPVSGGFCGVDWGRMYREGSLCREWSAGYDAG